MLRKSGSAIRVLKLFGALVLLAALLFVVTGCDGHRGGIVVAKRNDRTVTIAYCYVRAKLSDYVRQVSYRVSAEEFKEVAIGEWYVPDDDDVYLGSARGGWCDA